MHIVYTLLNITNKTKGINPYLYIGSKTNCKIENGEIYSLKNGKPYWSSSKSVRESINKGDHWRLDSWFEVFDDKDIYRVEGEMQDSVNAKNNEVYYNKAHANLRFNSKDEQTKEAISKAKTGKVYKHMLRKEYWQRLQSPEVRKTNSNSCKGNPNVINAARKRSERLAKDPEYVKWRSELTSKTFKGRKKTEHEIWLRVHDDRYKSNRKLTNEQVWEIRFGEHKKLNLKELTIVYPEVSKATLCRVRNFKVFKDIKEDFSQ